MNTARLPSRRSLILGFALIAITASGYWALNTGQQRGSAPPSEIQDQVYWQPREIGAFTLTRAGAEGFGPSSLRGKWTFLFFGYTHCPDVCPSTLAVLGQVFRRIDEDPGRAGVTQALLVSVDPRRDTPQALAEYVRFFHERFVGATGSTEALDTLTRQIGVTYSIQAPAPGAAPEHYQVAHSATIFLIDPLGRLLARFPPPHDAGEIAESFARVRAYFEERTGKRWGLF